MSDIWEEIEEILEEAEWEERKKIYNAALEREDFKTAHDILFSIYLDSVHKQKDYIQILEERIETYQEMHSLLIEQRNSAREHLKEVRQKIKNLKKGAN